MPKKGISVKDLEVARDAVLHTLIKIVTTTTNVQNFSAMARDAVCSRAKETMTVLFEAILDVFLQVTSYLPWCIKTGTPVNIATLVHCLSLILQFCQWWEVYKLWNEEVVESLKSFAHLLVEDH